MVWDAAVVSSVVEAPIRDKINLPLLFYSVLWEKGTFYGDVVRCYLAYTKIEEAFP